MTTTIFFQSDSGFSNKALGVLRSATERVYGEEKVAWVNEGVGINFGTVSTAGIRSLSPWAMERYPNAEAMVAFALYRYKHGCLPPAPQALYLDIETHGLEHRWNMPPSEYFRLGQYAMRNDSVTLTTDYDDVLMEIGGSRIIVAHNGHGFDWSVLLGNNALNLAREGRLFDTMVHASLVIPAPETYMNRKGQILVKTNKPEAARRWLSLDNLSFQLGLEGKIGDLTKLAEKYGGYGSIPLDNAEYLTYAEQDVIALRDLTAALWWMEPPTPYHWREQLTAAIDSQMSRNGFALDIEQATDHRNVLRDRTEVVLADLVTRYDFPTEGKMPWRSKVGKGAIFTALADVGIVPSEIPDWPLTDTGNISLGGEAMVEGTKGTSAEGLGEALAEIMGLRPLAQQALDYCQDDGRVHPEIDSLQRSGRHSTCKPGLTTYDQSEKFYFVASPGCKLVAFDYSAADVHAVAGMSGDTEFAKRLAPGVDSHDVSGRLFFGAAEYAADRANLRPLAKAAGLALGYRVGVTRLSTLIGVTKGKARNIIAAYQAAYPDVFAWQERVTEEGMSGWVENDWGRRMVVNPERSYTQASGLLGQSVTREILVDSLIRMLDCDDRLITWVVAQIHDELLFDIPTTELEWALPAIQKCMETDFRGIHFPVSVGEPANNWAEASH